MKISVIGFGYIGSVMAGVLAELGHEIDAVDNNKEAISNLKKGICEIPEPNLKELIHSGVSSGKINALSDFSNIKFSDAILVTVGTPLSENFDADLSAIKSVFKELSMNTVENQLVIIKSTVPPGTTRLLSEEFFKDKNINICFSPERLAEGNAINEFTRLPIVVGGINEKSTENAYNFWKSVLDVEVIKVSSSETAEMVKLADNQWIDLNVALANELAILCDSIDGNIDVMEVIQGANSLKKGMHYVNILSPSIGVGGYCLTKDPWFLDAISSKLNSPISLPKAGRLANENMPHYAYSIVNNYMKDTFQDYKNLKISIMGYSFKSDSGDTRFTPMREFIKFLINAGYSNLNIFDPMVPSNEIINSSNLKIHNNWQDCINDSYCCIFGVGHKAIKNISMNEIIKALKNDSLVLDGRLYLDKKNINQLIEGGITYKGIGRSF